MLELVDRDVLLVEMLREVELDVEEVEIEVDEVEVVPAFL